MRASETFTAVEDIFKVIYGAQGPFLRQQHAHSSLGLCFNCPFANDLTHSKLSRLVYECVLDAG